jgi:hypothetical protein
MQKKATTTDAITNMIEWIEDKVNHFEGKKADAAMEAEQASTSEDKDTYTKNAAMYGSIVRNLQRAIDGLILSDTFFKTDYNAD